MVQAGQSVVDSLKHHPVVKRTIRVGESLQHSAGDPPYYVMDNIRRATTAVTSAGKGAASTAANAGNSFIRAAAQGRAQQAKQVVTKTAEGAQGIVQNFAPSLLQHPVIKLPITVQEVIKLPITIKESLQHAAGDTANDMMDRFGRATTAMTDAVEGAASRAAHAAESVAFAAQAAKQFVDNAGSEVKLLRETAEDTLSQLRSWLPPWNLSWFQVLLRLLFLGVMLMLGWGCLFVYTLWLLLPVRAGAKCCCCCKMDSSCVQ